MNANQSALGLSFLSTATSGVTIGSGSTLTIGTSGIIKNSGQVVIFPSVSLNGNQIWRNDGTNGLSVLGAISGTGNLNLQNGILLSNASINNTGTITNSGTGTRSVTIEGVIGANVSGVIQNSATSSLILNGVNTYTGGTTLSAGTIEYKSSGFGTGNISVTGDSSIKTNTHTSTNNTVSINAGTTLTLHSNGYSQAMGGTISGSGSVNQIGNGALSLSANSYSGGTTINNGFVYIQNNSAFGTGTVTVAGNSTLRNLNYTIANAISINNGVTTTFDTSSSHSAVFNGVLSGAGSITKIGSGTLTFSNTNNSYTGATTISVGTLKLGAEGVISNSSALTVNGTLNMNGFNEIVGSLAGSGTVTSSAVGSPTLTVGGDGSSTTFSGIIQNGSATSVGVIKVGSGIWILSGANTYTGDTTVSSGTLVLGRSGAISSSSDLILSGGTLLTNGYNNTFSGLTLEADSVIDFDSGASRIEFSGIVAMNSHKLSIWNWVGDPWKGGTVLVHDQLFFSGDTTNVNFSDIIFYTDDGLTLWSNMAGVSEGSAKLFNNEIVPQTPEPSTYFVGFLLLTYSFIHFKRVKKKNIPLTEYSISDISFRLMPTKSTSTSPSSPCGSTSSATLTVAVGAQTITVFEAIKLLDDSKKANHILKALDAAHCGLVFFRETTSNILAHFNKFSSELDELCAPKSSSKQFHFYDRTLELITSVFNEAMDPSSRINTSTTLNPSTKLAVYRIPYIPGDYDALVQPLAQAFRTRALNIWRRIETKPSVKLNEELLETSTMTHLSPAHVSEKITEIEEQLRPLKEWAESQDQRFKKTAITNTDLLCLDNKAILEKYPKAKFNGKTITPQQLNKQRNKLKNLLEVTTLPDFIKDPKNLCLLQRNLCTLQTQLDELHACRDSTA